MCISIGLVQIWLICLYCFSIHEKFSVCEMEPWSERAHTHLTSRSSRPKSNLPVTKLIAVCSSPESFFIVTSYAFDHSIHFLLLLLHVFGHSEFICGVCFSWIKPNEKIKSPFHRLLKKNSLFRSRNNGIRLRRVQGDFRKDSGSHNRIGTIPV